MVSHNQRTREEDPRRTLHQVLRANYHDHLTDLGPTISLCKIYHFLTKRNNEKKHSYHPQISKLHLLLHTKTQHLNDTYLAYALLIARRRSDAVFTAIPRFIDLFLIYYYYCYYYYVYRPVSRYLSF
jgi:hypothetical protein